MISSFLCTWAFCKCKMLVWDEISFLGYVCGTKSVVAFLQKIALKRPIKA